MTKRRKSRQKPPILPGDIGMTAIKRRKLNKLVFMLMLVCICSALFHLIPAYQKLKPTAIIPTSTALKGIIITENPILYPLPSILSKDKSVTALNGSEVTITKKTDGWYQIQTDAGKYWIETSNLLIAGKT